MTSTVIAAVIVVVLLSGIRIAQEYQRGVGEYRREHAASETSRKA